ncbi:hypothetical protein WS62_17135 [Burkholderia sp. ABCPW 14]|uniref:hypothetical protein n=1 Tax=Burkholderia sp. ABCPW 14 TaxID=1637860 RepID=UPI000770BB08|nr:hypothetical protein [Burkholderia sp. ABCPW 14]KVD88350.1 hypothetical protein WS62_17135 [Burkholderia sp. ABCPW 14]
MKSDDDVRRRERECEPSERDVRKFGHVKAAMRVRGLAKVEFITIATSQALTAAFASLAYGIGCDVEPGPLLLFNFISCALVSFWLQSDAQRAYLEAQASGRLRKTPHADTLPNVPLDCPKRWLVILNIELNPKLLDDAR